MTDINDKIKQLLLINSQESNKEIGKIISHKKLNIIISSNCVVCGLCGDKFKNTNNASAHIKKIHLKNTF